jgi:hypothetical protein
LFATEPTSPEPATLSPEPYKILEALQFYVPEFIHIFLDIFFYPMEDQLGAAEKVLLNLTL